VAFSTLRFSSDKNRCYLQPSRIAELVTPVSATPTTYENRGFPWYFLTHNTEMMEPFKDSPLTFKKGKKLAPKLHVFSVQLSLLKNG
jgi:hypothetical protein